ncbi:helix-turn-helix domain-containing protein [Paracoccus fontiphilus]|uniref:Helix-turn-helix domain-containing protein n=1 Tax=Paracoccus fontiphilus TaxID=1815556 RepID=A0ABV7IG34_9RHOB|nr:helix-turn-helix domain-containing protein [Paracoccus fontiphilus]
MGRDRKNEDRAEHWTKMLRPTMETPAWRALSPTAQALYPWLKLEWRGDRANNNGKISLSVRDAAARLGCNVKTAAKAFHDLQAKGFLLLIDHGRMGVEGKGAPPTYEITELAMPGSDSHSGKKLYLHWRAGHDFAVRAHAPANPRGLNGKNSIPSQNSARVVPFSGTKT